MFLEPIKSHQLMITHQKILRVNKNNRENTDPKIKIDDPVLRVIGWDKRKLKRKTLKRNHNFTYIHTDLHMYA